MNNVINELSRIVNDVNNDSRLSQEQKETLNSTISGYIESINNRINAVNEARNSIRIRDDVIELYKCSYDDLVRKHGSEMKEDVSGSMEKVIYIPSLSVSAVYNASDGEVMPNQYGVKRVEGKLKNIVSNVDKSMTIDEFVNKMRSRFYDVTYEIKTADMASPYTFDLNHVEVNVDKKEYVNPDENKENLGQEYNYSWGALLKIAIEGYNSVGPDSIVWFRGSGGAL